MSVLDASAVLALLRDEPGADEVAGAQRGAVIGAANLAEVVGKVVGKVVEVGGTSRRCGDGCPPPGC